MQNIYPLINCLLLPGEIGLEIWYLSDFTKNGRKYYLNDDRNYKPLVILISNTAFFVVYFLMRKKVYIRVSKNWIGFYTTSNFGK